MGTRNEERGTRSGAQGFEGLEVWQKAIDFAVAIYSVTKSFPKEELYALTNQMRRASSSISANIAEGHGRYAVKDKIHFYKIANGSLNETVSFCYLAERLHYLDWSSRETLVAKGYEIQRMLIALIKSQEHHSA